MARAWIGIGSNLGDRHAYIDQARQALDSMPQSELVAFSEIYETEPISPVEQGPYLNAAAELRTQLSPPALLQALVAVECQAGRPPNDERVHWGPRTLDLDILLYGGLVISGDDLVIPHPLMHERWFVLKPLCDIDPQIVHPILEMTVGELLRHVENVSRERAEETQP